MKFTKALANRTNAKRPSRRSDGFSLIELLIVVAIILVIAAIAIPNLLRSRMAANEASAAQSLRTIHTGMTTYSTVYPDVGYAATLDALGGTTAACAPPAVATPAAACMVESNLSITKNKSGYTFAGAGGIVGGGAINNIYTVTATPSAVGVTGQRGFFINESGAIRYSLDGTLPTAASSSLP
jgi:prepilin-type N-terminal cleavage/methylation domain-containing protein